MTSTAPQSDETRKVLLVHESRTIARVIARIMARMGAEVTYVRTRNEFFDMVHQHSWNLAILGSDFDGIKGAFLCETLREHWNSASVPVILLSSDEKERSRAYEAGADFFLELPLDPIWSPKIFERYLLHRRCVVAADDSATIRLQLSSQLKKDGYWVITSKDGEEAWSHIKRFVPDVVLLDVQMPRLDGYALCERIRQNPVTRHTPVVFITSNSSPADLERSFNVGANEFLPKPLEEEELRQLLNRIFRGMSMRGRDRILVIDDSPTVLGMLRYGLGQHGFQIVCARNGEEGLRKALRFRPTVVISDWQMPRMTGTELCKKLREHDETKDCAIILLSSRSSRADAMKALREGADEYIVKPFNFERLIATVERLVAERNLRRERELLRTYLPATVRQLAEKLAPGTSDLGKLRADERVLTVLFLDIVGFTRLCEKRSPREVITLLNGFYEKMAGHIKKHSGVIDKFIGDAILVLFGFEDVQSGAANALACAQSMQAETLAAGSNDDVLSIWVRIGINTGPLIYGDLGVPGVRRDFTVIGDAVNVAQRLESLAPSGQIMISHATMEHLSFPRPEAEEMLSKVKGRQDPVRCYCLPRHSTS